MESVKDNFYSVSGTIKKLEDELFYDIDYPTDAEWKDLEESNKIYLEKLKSRKFEVSWGYFSDSYYQKLYFEDSRAYINIHKNDKLVYVYKFHPIAIKINWFWLLNKHNNSKKLNSISGNGVWDIQVESKTKMPSMNFRQKEIWDKIRKDVIGLK